MKRPSPLRQHVMKRPSPLRQHVVIENLEDFPKATGITRREYFAGCALQGFLASGFRDCPDALVARSVSLADALVSRLDSGVKK